MYIGLRQGLVAKYALLCTFVWAGGHYYWYYWLLGARCYLYIKPTSVGARPSIYSIRKRMTAQIIALDECYM